MSKGTYLLVGMVLVCGCGGGEETNGPETTNGDEEDGADASSAPNSSGGATSSGGTTSTGGDLTGGVDGAGGSPAAGTGGSTPLPPLDPNQSCQEDTGIILPTPAQYSEYNNAGFSRYAELKAPNGNPILIFAQDQVTDAMVMRAYNILRFFVTDAPGTMWGADKTNVANRMADNEAVLVMPNGSHTSDPSVPGQPQFQNETQVEGSVWYMQQDYNHRDSTFEEVFHLVHDTGIGAPNGGALPTYGTEIQTHAVAAQSGGLWTWGPGDIEGGQEYIISVIDSYYGLWEAWDGNGGIFGEYVAGSRAAIADQDPTGLALVEAYLPPYLTYEARLDPAFDATFSITLDTSLPYTHVSQYLVNVTLTGVNDSNVTGNALDNTLRGNSGDNELDGGTGHDTIVYCNPRADYSFSGTASDLTVAGPDGTDLLKNAEEVYFADGRVPVSDLLP